MRTRCVFFGGFGLVSSFSVSFGSVSGLVAGAVSSPPLCPAPFVSEVRRLAVVAGASWLCLRPSSRSFSRWCVVVFFSSRAAAAGFAAPVPAVLPGACFSSGVSSVLVRRCGAWWCVSVPVSVLFPLVPVSRCPVLFAPVG